MGSKLEFLIISLSKYFSRDTLIHDWDSLKYQYKAILGLCREAWVNITISTVLPSTPDVPPPIHSSLPPYDRKLCNGSNKQGRGFNSEP